MICVRPLILRHADVHSARQKRDTQCRCVKLYIPSVLPHSAGRSNASRARVPLSALRAVSPRRSGILPDLRSAGCSRGRCRPTRSGLAPGRSRPPCGEQARWLDVRRQAMETIGRQARRARDQASPCAGLRRRPERLGGGGEPGAGRAQRCCGGGAHRARARGLGGNVGWAPPDATLPVPELWRGPGRRAANAARGPSWTGRDRGGHRADGARRACACCKGRRARRWRRVTLLAGKWGCWRRALVIDASARGRLAAEMGATWAAAPRPVVRRALMVHTDVTEPRRWRWGGPAAAPVLAWPTLWPGDVVIEAEFDLPAEDRRARCATPGAGGVAARLRAADGARYEPHAHRARPICRATRCWRR